MPSKCGIPRDWSRSEQLSVSEKLSLRSGSASTSARYINSVSDLYAADEIDALLDEIRDLEPISVHGDDVQDFEIDGSVTRLPYNYNMTYCDSRTSVHSWDSHALYHNNTMEDTETRVGGPVSLYCDTSHLKTPIGLLRIVLLVTSMVSLGCLCYAGTSSYSVLMLPFVARIRLMLFIILFSCLVTILLMFLDISRLYHAFPIHYHRWVVAVYLIECAGFCSASALIVDLVQIYARYYPSIAKVTRDQLIVSSIFGFIAGAVALFLAILAIYELCRFHLPLREDTDQLTLTERAAREMHDQSNARQKSAPQPTQLEPPVTTTVWPIDDVQPCSSKHMQKSNNHYMSTNSHSQIHSHS